MAKPQNPCSSLIPPSFPLSNQNLLTAEAWQQQRKHGGSFQDPSSKPFSTTTLSTTVSLNPSSFTAPEASEKPPSFSNVYSPTGTKALTSPATSTSPNPSNTATLLGPPGPTARRPLSPTAGVASKTASNPWPRTASAPAPSRRGRFSLH